MIGIAELCTLLLVVLYAPYMSFRAIQSVGLEDDKQWLTFWVVYSVFEVLEKVTDTILEWVPYYYVVKLVIVIYLMFLGGATHIYDFLEPIIRKNEDHMRRSISGVSPSTEDKPVDNSQEPIMEEAKKTK